MERSFKGLRESASNFYAFVLEVIDSSIVTVVALVVVVAVAVVIAAVVVEIV